MKILILGNGFLGSAFTRHGYDMGSRTIFEWDIVNGTPIQDVAYLSEVFANYDAVVNCIGKSDTRWCEDPGNFNELMAINADVPKFISTVCSDVGVKFVHISTGCLFDSRGAGKSNECDFKSAHCNYVVSKWAGEGYLSDNDLIIRPRLLFDSYPATGRNNLIQKLKEFNTFLNEFNSITSCDTIIESVETLLEANCSGIFNVANDGAYTIYEMAMSLGCSGDMISQEDLHKTQQLFLVNNVMDISKLKKYYTPRDTIVELDRCRKILDSSCN